MRKIASITAIALTAIAINIPPASAGQTYMVTSSALCGGAGTFQDALNKANSNPKTVKTQARVSEPPTEVKVVLYVTTPAADPA